VQARKRASAQARKRASAQARACLFLKQEGGTSAKKGVKFINHNLVFLLKK
jgi:hypothetical protein